MDYLQELLELAAGVIVTILAFGVGLALLIVMLIFTIKGLQGLGVLL